VIKTIKRIKSWLRRPKRYWQIFWIITRVKPKNIMEIGTWTGDRALTMIRLAQRYHGTKQVDYYGFDLFGQMTTEIFIGEKSKWPPTQQEAFNKLSATGANIHLFQGDTMKVLPEMTPKLLKMDLIFIDGGHSLETIANDWHWVSQLMHDKTVVIFDDYWPDRTDAGCKVTVNGIDRKKYIISILPWTDKFKNTSFGEPLNIKLAKVRRRI